jgi:hypothetical protein
LSSDERVKRTALGKARWPRRARSSESKILDLHACKHPGTQSLKSHQLPGLIVLARQLSQTERNPAAGMTLVAPSANLTLL